MPERKGTHTSGLIYDQHGIKSSACRAACIVPVVGRITFQVSICLSNVHAATVPELGSCYGLHDSLTGPFGMAHSLCRLNGRDQNQRERASERPLYCTITRCSTRRDLVYLVTRPRVVTCSPARHMSVTNRHKAQMQSKRDI